MTTGLVIAAPASGSGKTIVTLGLLRAFSNSGLSVGSLKVGPDYIDTDFHRLASGQACRNYDLWAMRDMTLEDQLGALLPASDLIIAEGVMGLFDGALDGSGSTADAAAKLGWPVVLVVDVKGQSASAAAVIEGFTNHRADIAVAGVIFNRVGGPRHRDILARAMVPLDIPVLGHVPWSAALDLPSRHLGLIQAREHGDLDAWLNEAAHLVSENISLDALRALAAPVAAPAANTNAPALPPLGQRISVARDDAFAFSYPHIFDGWRLAGAEVSFFSPLADEAPDNQADAIYLPGGYPELHAGRLAGNGKFLDGLRAAAESQVVIYGECGGYMVLGETLTDADGAAHPMAGLLPVTTSFAERKLHLGYRRAELLGDGPLGSRGRVFKGHEFHYATYDETGGTALFSAKDALGENVQSAGQRQGSVFGSFVHLIDRVG